MNKQNEYNQTLMEQYQAFKDAHPPGIPLSTEDQLKLDKLVCGCCIYTVDEKGNKTRHDPTKTVIEYLTNKSSQ